MALVSMPYPAEFQMYFSLEINYILPSSEFLNYFEGRQPMKTLFNVSKKDEKQIESWLENYCTNINDDLTYTSKSTMEAEFCVGIDWNFKFCKYDFDRDFIKETGICHARISGNDQKTIKRDVDVGRRILCAFYKYSSSSCGKYFKYDCNKKLYIRIFLFNMEIYCTSNSNLYTVFAFDCAFRTVSGM